MNLLLSFLNRNHVGDKNTIFLHLYDLAPEPIAPTTRKHLGPLIQ